MVAGWIAGARLAFLQRRQTVLRERVQLLVGVAQFARRQHRRLGSGAARSRSLARHGHQHAAHQRRVRRPGHRALPHRAVAAAGCREVRPRERDRPPAPVRRAQEPRRVRDPDHEQLLAMVGRLLPVPGLGRQGPRALSAAVPGWQLGHLPEHRRDVLLERHRRRALQQPAQARRPAAGVEPDRDLGAGQRAARHEEREGVPQVDRRHRAPDPLDGAGAAGHHRQRRADRLGDLRRHGHGGGPPEPVHRLHHFPPLGRELELAVRERTSRAATPRPWKRPRRTSTITRRAPPSSTSRCCSRSSASRATSTASRPTRR